MGVVGNFFKGWGRAGQLIAKGTHPRGMPIGLKSKLEEGGKLLLHTPALWIYFRQKFESPTK